MYLRLRKYYNFERKNSRRGTIIATQRVKRHESNDVSLHSKASVHSPSFLSLRSPNVPRRMSDSWSSRVNNFGELNRRSSRNLFIAARRRTEAVLVLLIASIVTVSPSFLPVPDDLHVRVNRAKSEPRVEGAWVISSRSFERGHADLNLSIGGPRSFVRTRPFKFSFTFPRVSSPGCANTQLPSSIESPPTVINPLTFVLFPFFFFSLRLKFFSTSFRDGESIRSVDNSFSRNRGGDARRLLMRHRLSVFNLQRRCEFIIRAYIRWIFYIFFYIFILCKNHFHY